VFVWQCAVQIDQSSFRDNVTKRNCHKCGRFSSDVCMMYAERCLIGGAENAGLENAASDCRGGKRGTGKCRSLKSMESEDFKNVF